MPANVVPHVDAIDDSTRTLRYRVALLNGLCEAAAAAEDAHQPGGTDFWFGLIDLCEAMMTDIATIETNSGAWWALTHPTPPLVEQGRPS